jgi:hypothetical protein
MQNETVESNPQVMTGRPIIMPVASLDSIASAINEVIDRKGE